MYICVYVCVCVCVCVCVLLSTLNFFVSEFVITSRNVCKLFCNVLVRLCIHLTATKSRSKVLFVHF